MLFSIVRAVPTLDSNADVAGNLALARQFAEKRSDSNLVERIAQTQANLQVFFLFILFFSFGKNYSKIGGFFSKFYFTKTMKNHNNSV